MGFLSIPYFLTLIFVSHASNLLISSITVRNYDKWLNVYNALKKEEHFALMKMREVESTLLLEETIDKSGKSVVTPSQTSSRPVFTEVSFLLDDGSAAQSFFEHGKMEGRFFHSANQRGDIDLASYTSRVYNMSFSSGWVYKPSARYRQDDVIVLSYHRTTSFVKWVDFFEDHLELWMRKGLLGVKAGYSQDRVGQMLILCTHWDRLNEANAFEFNSWYKDMINNGLSRLYKANARGFALAPVSSSVYSIRKSYNVTIPSLVVEALK